MKVNPPVVFSLFLCLVFGTSCKNPPSVIYETVRLSLFLSGESFPLFSAVVLEGTQEHVRVMHSENCCCFIREESENKVAVALSVDLLYLEREVLSVEISEYQSYLLTQRV